MNFNNFVILPDRRKRNLKRKGKSLVLGEEEEEKEKEMEPSQFTGDSPKREPRNSHTPEQS